MNKLIFIFIACILFSCSSETKRTKPITNTFQKVISPDSMVSITLKNLEASGIDTIVVFKQDGEFAGFRTIFWRSGGKDHVAIPGPGNEMTTLKPQYSQLIETIVANLKQVQAETVKPPNHLQGDKVFATFTTHPAITQFHIQFGKLGIIKTINHYDLETKKLNDSMPNDNYKYNQGSILKKLKEIAEKETEALRQVG